MFGRFSTKQLVLTFCTLFLALFCDVGDRAFAASSMRILTKSGSPVLISTSSMFGDSEKQTVEMAGDVQITFEGQSLRADRATMNKATGMIVAEGNVIIASTSAYVEGSSASLSYEDNTGVIYDGFVKSGQVLFQGKVIRKVGIDKYEAEKAQYTACTTCPPAWSFTGSRIDAEIGAYAYIKSAWFFLGGVRFFWLPYLIVPLKSERQTGVLFPAYEILGEGFAFGLPFFWAISRSQDMTLTPKYYTKRGFKGLLNYRYVLNNDSTGELNFGGLLSDKIFADEEYQSKRPGDERSGRWFLAHDHIYTLPGGFINRARLNLVSDLRYTRDFPEDMGGLGEPTLENRISLTKNTEFTHSSIEAAYYVNQLKQNPLEGNAESVHRFPEIKQAGVDRSLFDSRIFLKWDFDYVNFAREDLAYDDVRAGVGNEKSKVIDRTRGAYGAGSGVFQPDVDMIRTGQRLDLRPELSAPFRIGRFLDVLPSIQFRHTQYSFNVAPPTGTVFEPAPSREYIRGRLAIRTQASRIYDLGDEVPEEVERNPASEGEQAGIFQALQPPPPVQRLERLKHEIEPELSISGIPWLVQTDSLFFGDNAISPIFIDGQPVSDTDFYSTKRLQFDYEDRITQRNLIAAQILNRFTKKTWNGDQPVYRQVVSIKNGTSYEFDKRDRNINMNFSDVYTIVDARFENFDSNASVRYFPYHHVFNTSIRARVFDKTGNFLQTTFSQNNLITENVAEAYAKREENLGFAFGFVHRFIVASADLNFLPATYSPLSLQMKGWSAMVALKPPGDCWGVRVAVIRILSEEKPHFTFGFDYNFGGTI